MYKSHPTPIFHLIHYKLYIHAYVFDIKKDEEDEEESEEEETDEEEEDSDEEEDDESYDEEDESIIIEGEDGIDMERQSGDGEVELVFFIVQYLAYHKKESCLEKSVSSQSSHFL